MPNQRTGPGPPHIVMVADNDLVADTRVRKEAKSLADGGYRVTVVGKAREGVSTHERVGGAVIIRVPVPDTILDELWAQRLRRRQRRIPLAGYPSRRAYDAARLRLQARRRDIDAASARALIQHADGVVSRSRLQASVLNRTIRLAVLRARETAVRGRGYVRHQMNRAAATIWQGWDRAVAQHELGANWRRANPGLDDLELAYGPVIDRLDADVIHAQDVFCIGISARAVARARLAGRSVAFVYDAHEFAPGLPRHKGRSPRYAAAIERLEREYIHDADRIITVSPAIAVAMAEHYQLERTPAVVLNTPAAAELRDDGPEVRQTTGVATGTPLLVYSGSIKQVRGVDVVIRALPFLPGFHLAVVCVPNATTSAAMQLRAEANRLGLSDRVHLVEPVPSDEVVAFLASADIGVHPLLSGIVNHEMALPNKLFEYVHAGLPVVVTDLPELSRFVRQHGVGETFRSGEPVDLASSVQKVLADPEHYRRAAADRSMRAEYSWERQAELLRAVYEELLAPSG